MMVYLDIDGSQRTRAERELRPRADGAVRAGRRQLHARRTCARRRAPSPAGTVPRNRDRRQRRHAAASPSFGRSASTTAARPSSARPATSGRTTSSTSSWSSRRRRATSRGGSSPSSSTRTRRTQTSSPSSTSTRRTARSIGAVVEAMLRSDVFYSPKAYRAIVKSPVEYAVGAVKALGAAGTACRSCWRTGAGARKAAASLGDDGPDALRAAERRRLAGRRALAQQRDDVRAAQLRQPAAPAARSAAAQPAATPPAQRRRQPAPLRDSLGTAEQALAHYLPLVAGRQPAGRSAPGPARLRRRRRTRRCRRSSCAASSTWSSARRSSTSA